MTYKKLEQLNKLLAELLSDYGHSQDEDTLIILKVLEIVAEKEIVEFIKND